MIALENYVNDMEAFRTQYAEHAAAVAEIINAWKQSLRAEACEYSPKQFDLLFNEVWKRSIKEGYLAVEQTYYDLVYLVNEFQLAAEDR